jgi:hypothetical protein
MIARSVWILGTLSLPLFRGLRLLAIPKLLGKGTDEYMPSRSIPSIASAITIRGLRQAK